MVTERDWYHEGMEHEDFALGVPYQDADTGEMIVSISSKANIKDGEIRFWLEICS